MSPNLPGRRLYSEADVARILQLATEVPADDRGSGGEAQGLSLAQLVEVAREVGIDPARVEAAARALDRQPPRAASGLLGMGMTMRTERVVDTAADPERFPRVVEIIRDHLARHGIVHAELGGLEWRARDAAGSRYVTVRPDGDRTVVRGLLNFRDGAVGTAATAAAFSPVVALLAQRIAGGLGLEGLGLLVVPTAIAGTLVTAWRFWRGKFRREAQALTDAVEEIEQHLLAEGVGGPADDTAARPERP